MKNLVLASIALTALLIGSGIGFAQIVPESIPTPAPQPPIPPAPIPTQPQVTAPQQPAPNQPAPNQPQTITARGKVVRAVGGDQIILQVNGKEMTFASDPRTIYWVNGKNVRFSDLTPGLDLSVMYTTQGDRYLASQYYTGTTPAVQGPAPGAAISVQGRVVRTIPPDQIVVLADGKEVILFANPQTKIQLNRKAAVFTDLVAGANVILTYTQQGDRFIVTSVLDADSSVGVLPQPVNPMVTPGKANEATELTGTVVRVVGTDQVIVRTAMGGEVTVHVMPQTTYTINEQPGRYTDLRPGIEVQVQYQQDGNRRVARNVLQRVLKR